MKKNICVLLIMFSLLFLVSCKREIPEIETGESSVSSLMDASISEISTTPDSLMMESTMFSITEAETEKAGSLAESDVAEDSSSATDSEETSPIEQDETLIQGFLAQNESAELCGYCHVPSGGVFASFIDHSINVHDDINNRDLYFMNFYIIKNEENYLSPEELDIYDVFEKKYYLFYDEDWEKRINGAYDGTTTSYKSCFYWHTGEIGEEAIIFVFPNIEYPAYDTGIPTVEYKLSQFYQIEPSDSLGTVPVCLQYKGWNDDYPAWVFVVDKEDIYAEYELHYMDYVLTGTELLNKSWRIGNATPIEQYLDEWIHQSEEEASE